MNELSASTNRFGDYILHDRIGAGGMAEIFLATATGIEGFEKRIVIKRILPSLSDDVQFVRMFIEEAKLCVALRHPNIVQVHDLGAIDGQYYIAMEYVDGRDLLKTLAACGKKKIGFPTDIALFIVMEVLKGLHYAHQLKQPNGDPLGIIHRDVSPSNVLLSFEGEVKLGDFGIAKARTRETTAAGILKGKFGYMAPEQVTGVPIDSRADVFAVGIVLYELLTGHRLFAGKNDLAVLEKVRDARIEPPLRHYRHDLDDDLDHLVMRALARDPRDRYPIAQELHDAINDYVYRSGATVGPAHLARFMQTLFLNDPDEIDRRTRVGLPQPRSFRIGATPTNGSNSTTGVSGISRALELLTDGFPGDFDEKTPFFEPASLPRSHPLSSVAFISNDDSWEQAGSSALIDYVRADPIDDEEGQKRRPPPVPARTGLRPPSESTARTDVEALEVDPPPIRVDDSNQSPLARVAALRAAVELDAPTDLDLTEDSERMALDPEKKTLPRDISTVYGRGQTSEQRNGIANEEDDDTTQKKSDDADDYLDPSHIVERTVPTSDEIALEDDELTSEIAATIRFDSTSAGLAPIPDRATTANEQIRADDSEETAREREAYDTDDEPSGERPSWMKASGGSLHLEDTDLLTGEVSEDELRDDSTLRSETDTIPGSGQSPLDREASRTDVELDLPDALVSPILDDEERADRTDMDHNPPSFVKRRSSSLFDDSTRPDDVLFESEIDGFSDQASVNSAQRAVAEIRRARRASRMANDLAKEEARGPSRRRPITSRRPRPLLLPAEDELEPKLTTNPRGGKLKPRRRGTATRSIAIVNPLPRQASLRRPIVQVKPRDELLDAETTGAGLLVEEDTPSPGIPAASTEPMDTPVRRRNSGVTAALSEAALVDHEIAEIRNSTSRGRPPEDETAREFYQEDEDDDYIPEWDEEETKQGIKVKEAVDRIQSRKRIVTQNFVLYSDRQTYFDDDDSETSAPAITSAGRLEDEGASGLFGALEALGNETLDEANFGTSEEEGSLETDSRDYGSGEYGAKTRLGLLAEDEESTDGEIFDEDSTASVTDADVLSVSQLMRSNEEPDVVEMAEEESGISIRFEQSHAELSEAELDPMEKLDKIEKSGFEFTFTDNEDPTEEQTANEKERPRRPAETLFEGTSNERPARSISDGFDLNGDIEPMVTPNAETRAPVAPVSMVAPRDRHDEDAEELPMEQPGRAKPSKESALRRVVQRHTVAKEVRLKGPNAAPTGELSPSSSTPAQPPRAMGTPGQRAIPTVGQRAIPTAGQQAIPTPGQFYPPVQNVVVRGSSALNKFATFAVLIAVLLAVAAAVSILLQNRPHQPIAPLTEITEANRDPQKPPPPSEPPPTEKEQTKPPVAPSPAEKPKEVKSKEVKPPPAIRKKVEEPAPRPAKIASPEKGTTKKKRLPRAKGDSGLLRVSCAEPVDIKIPGIGTVKQKKKYERELKPGDYQVTLFKDGVALKKYDVTLVLGDPAEIHCPL